MDEDKKNAVQAVYERIENIISELDKESWKALELKDDGETFMRIRKETQLWEYLKFCLLNRGVS